MNAGAAIVVSLGSVAVIAAVAWFMLNTKHPENAASHAEAPREDVAPREPADGSRPAGPGAEADGVAGPGQPTPGASQPGS